MKPFGLFIMRNRLNAVLLALAFAAVPLFNWLAMIIMALVTLRKGPKEGALIAVVAFVPAIVYGILSNLATLPYVFLTLGSLWLLAVALRSTQTWSAVLLVGALIALVIIVGMHWYLGDVAAWWQQKMLSYLQQAGKEIALNTDDQTSLIKRMSVFGLGLQIAVLLLVGLMWLMLARFWQAVLYNPGALRPELCNVRLPVWSAVAVVILSAAALLTQAGVLLDFMPVLALCFALAGLSVTHFVLTRQKRSWIWFVLMYVALFFLLPYMLVALIVIALSDSFFNVRRRYAAT